MKTLIHFIGFFVEIVSLIVLSPFGWIFHLLNLYDVFTGKYTWCFKAYGRDYLPVVRVYCFTYF